MKITLRILRIICKIFLLGYVTIVNFIFILVFYILVLEIVRMIFPTLLSGLFERGLVPHIIGNLPFYLLLIFILYALSPVNNWRIRQKGGYRRPNESEQIRLNRLLSEIGMDRKLTLYRNREVAPNAVTFGFNTIGITDGMMRQASDEELKGVICHEVGHLSHYDYVYGILIYSLELFGYQCLYGIFFIPAFIFGIIGSMVFALVPGLTFVGALTGKIWWMIYKLLHHIIYGISRFLYVNINKYAEYRCDAYAVKYGCGEGLLSFLRGLKREEDVYGECPTFTEYMMSTHPATAKRVKRLEKMLG